MKRISILFLVTTALLVGCAPGDKPQSGGQAQSTAAGSGGTGSGATASGSTGTGAAGSGSAASSYAAAAEKVTDVCTLIPAEYITRLIPNAFPASSERYPRQCTIRNNLSALQVSIDTGFVPVDPIQGAEFIPGLAEGGYLERLSPNEKGDVYLTVILGKDPKALLHVEVAGHDGKDHRDDAIAIARDILTRLQ
jgi:hypothetical protein